MRALVFALALALGSSGLFATDLTRDEVIAVARSYASYQWMGRPENVKKGADAEGVAVMTPSAASASEAQPGWWVVGQTNTGVPYKWGGFDSLESFATGIRKGKAAGDLYNPGKRKLGGAAVSGEAVGLDCSGFISRCWKLSKKYDTATLAALCVTLPTAADLKPGDIMNYPNGHVVLFHRWLDGAKDHAEFYEAEPYSKVLASDRSTVELAANGFKALRYRKIKD